MRYHSFNPFPEGVEDLHDIVGTGEKMLSFTSPRTPLATIEPLVKYSVRPQHAEASELCDLALYTWVLYWQTRLGHVWGLLDRSGNLSLFFFSQNHAVGEVVRTSNPHEETMSFPEIYPDGNYGMGATREIPLSRSTYIKARLRNKDPRFRQSHEWVFLHRSMKDKVSLTFDSKHDLQLITFWH